jgi:hypothetical protein
MSPQRISSISATPAMHSSPSMLPLPGLILNAVGRGGD